MNDIYKKYNFKFLMLPTSRVVSQTGTLLEGNLQILSCKNDLLPGFYLEIQDNNMMLLCTKGLAQFNSKNYIVIEM